MQERGEEYGLRAANRQDTRGNVLQVVGRKPLARMTSTAWWRSSASTWRMMRRRWFLTVNSDRFRLAAISLLVRGFSVSQGTPRLQPAVQAIYNEVALARTYRSREDSVRKNTAGVAMRTPVRFATAWVKCLVLCVSNQSGLLATEERSTGTSAACRIR